MRRLFPPNPNADELDADDLAAAYAVPPVQRPQVRVGFVASADGAATSGGRTAPLSSPADQQILVLLRDLADVVMVGAGTIRTEGYTALQATPRRRARREALGLSPVPPLAIVSHRLDLDLEAPVFHGAARTIVVTTRRAPVDRVDALRRVADVIAAGEDELDIRGAIAALAERGLPRIVCEGGARLFGALQAADAVDELCLTISPYLTGGMAGRVVRDSAELQRRLQLRHVLESEGYLFLRYVRA